MSRLDELKVKIFADGADIDGIVKMSQNPLIKGFTTNPTLMRKAGVADYESFARRIIAAVPDYPVSFEVFADDFDEMIAQGRAIASWGKNVNVKVPITDTNGNLATRVIQTLSGEGIVLNVTAIMTLDQVRAIAKAQNPEAASIVSVFAGRIADTGVDPVPHMRECLKLLAGQPRAELLWASPRELLNIFHADEVGAHIITVTNDVLAKLALVGRDLDQYSRETVQMFHRDATAAAYRIDASRAAA
ncbi:MAG: transaldolase [Roseiarcus sp.]|jgi:transaldolase